MEHSRASSIRNEVRAYTACILANIAFLEAGQFKVLHASGIAPLMKLLKQKKEDTKVTLHSTAAIQNLTYKNTECCAEVLDHQGEKALKNLLTHKKEDVQQFAAGALANLQLYKRKDEPVEAKPKGQKLSMKVANILSRKGKDSPRPVASGGGGSSIDQQMVVEAAMKLQAVWRGHLTSKKVRVLRAA